MRFCLSQYFTPECAKVAEGFDLFESNPVYLGSHCATTCTTFFSYPESLVDVFLGDLRGLRGEILL